MKINGLTIYSYSSKMNNDLDMFYKIAIKSGDEIVHKLDIVHVNDWPNH